MHWYEGDLRPVPEMSAKKVIFRMENCGHLPAEYWDALSASLRKLEIFSVRTSAIFPYAGPQLSAERSAEVCGRLRTSVQTSADIFADIYADVRMDWCGRPHGWMRTSAWMDADVCGSPHGWVRTSAGPEDLFELLPLLCNNLLIICGITWSYAVWLSF